MLFGTHGARDLHGVACFIELQGDLFVQLQRKWICKLCVLAALQQFVLGVDGFHFSLGVIAHHVFHHNQIAWHGYGVVGFRSYHQAEDLHFRSDIQLASVSVQQDLSQIGSTALRRDGPQHIGEVFRAEAVCRTKVIEFHFDFDVALFALYLGFTIRLRKQLRATEVDFGGAAAMPVVDRRGSSFRDGDTEDGGIPSSQPQSVFVLTLERLCCHQAAHQKGSED